MKQFYELYKDDEKVSPLVTQLSWTHHLIIMSTCKSAEERLFYMTLCIRERYSKRELQRQIDSGYYERYMLSKKPTTPAIAEVKRATGNVFLDTYTLDFLDLPESVSERDFSSAIVNNLKNFILEIGKISLLSVRNTAYRSATTIISSTYCSSTVGSPVLWRSSLKSASSSPNISAK